MKDASGSLVQIIPQANVAVPSYTGATSSAAGTAGLVPAAQSSEREKFLRGDGTWQEASGGTSASYQGATASANGVAGLVPAATSANREKFLRGDGTWQEAASPAYVLTDTDPETDQNGTFNDVDGMIFYVPDLNDSGNEEPSEP